MTAPGGRWRPAHLPQPCFSGTVSPASGPSWIPWSGRGPPGVGVKAPAGAEGSSPCPRAPYPSARPLGGRARACRGCGRDSGVMPSPAGPVHPSHRESTPHPIPAALPASAPARSKFMKRKQVSRVWLNIFVVFVQRLR